MKKYCIKLFTSSDRAISNPTFKKVQGGQEGFFQQYDTIQQFFDVNEAYQAIEEWQFKHLFDSIIVEEIPS